MYKKTIIIIAALILAVIPRPSTAQDKLRDTYRERAESMFGNIWMRYRVHSETGLFLESYPAGKNDSLNYFQGEAVKEKKVSFLWPFSGMFSAANMLMHVPGLKEKYRIYQDSLVAGIEQYKDSVRKPVGYQAYPVKFEKADRYYDDNGLVGVDYMESYFNTKNPLYLQRAKDVFKFIISGWNNDVGGGITWLEGHNDQKPACSNGMALLTALKIYKGSREKYYLEQGERIYTWMYNSLRDSTTGIISNDIKLNGKQNRTFWTYNTGSMIEAAVLLYQFTGKQQFLQQAKALSLAGYKHFKATSGGEGLMMRIDVPWFVTVLFRGYEALYKVDKDDRYIAAIEHDLNYAWENSKDKFGLTTHSWLPKPGELTKPKWLLDEACIAELYARLSVLR